MLDIKEQQRIFRHNRIRQRVVGTSQRPRLCVHKSLNNFQAQIIDDVSGKILLGKSTLAKDIRSKVKTGGNIRAAEILGEVFAVKAIQQGVKKVCFDRGGYLYHGRIKAFVEAVRKAGLEF